MLCSAAPPSFLRIEKRHSPQKRAETMPEDIFYFKESDIPSDIPDIPREVFAPLREGLIAGTLVEIEYENALSEDSKRQILPEVLFRSSENWYLAAYCTLKNEPRTFRLDRILSALNTGMEKESGGVAEDIRANGIPWRREQGKDAPDGENNAPEWRRIELKPGENAPDYQIPPPDPEWLREMEQRKVCLDLIRHAGEGKLERMEEDIAAGADINFLDGSGDTPFMAAAHAGCLEAAKLLIRHGADPDKRGRTTCTVLNEAARSGRMEMIRYLVEELKLPVNQQDYFGWSPVFCAAQHCCIEALQYLLEHGGDPNLPDKDGVTPLMRAFHDEFSTCEIHIRIAELLVKYGADVNRRNKYGNTALFYAVSWRNWEPYVEFLRNAGADFKVCDKKGVSLLRYAATFNTPGWNHDFPNKGSNERPETVKLAKYLIRHGVNPNLPDSKGVVPVMPATGELLKCLLENGANPSAADEFGRTAAMYHANGKSDLLLLQKYGADIHARDLRGNDVLLSADISPEQITFLIKTFGFSVNDRNYDGVSILHRASLDLSLNTVKYLIRHGANPAIRTKDGKTPLGLMYTHHFSFFGYDCLNSHDVFAIEEFLKRQLANVTSDLFKACRAMDLKIIRRAVTHGANVRHILVRFKHQTVLTIASERFADPANGVSWLQFLRIYVFLKRNGADILAIDEDGNGVLDALFKRDCRGCIKRYMRTAKKMMKKMDTDQLEKIVHSWETKRDRIKGAQGGACSKALNELIFEGERILDEWE